MISSVKLSYSIQTIAQLAIRCNLQGNSNNNHENCSPQQAVITATEDRGIVRARRSDIRITRRATK